MNRCQVLSLILYFECLLISQEYRSSSPLARLLTANSYETMKIMKTRFLLKVLSMRQFRKGVQVQVLQPADADESLTLNLPMEWEELKLSDSLLVTVERFEGSIASDNIRRLQGEKESSDVCNEYKHHDDAVYQGCLTCGYDKESHYRER